MNWDARKLKRFLTIISFAALTSLGIRYLLSSRFEMLLDIGLSIFGLLVFLRLYNKLNQDLVSYFFFSFSLVLHNLALYGTSPFGIMFDHYMHFVGGFAIAIISDRVLTEKLTSLKRLACLVIFALGIGAIGEIIEWFGYAILGKGEGFLFYGAGDDGEWRNAMFDLVFDALGGVFMAIFGWAANYSATRAGIKKHTIRFSAIPRSANSYPEKDIAAMADSRN